MLTHAAGFLMLLVQRKGRFMLAGEAKGACGMLLGTFWCAMYGDDESD